MHDNATIYDLETGGYNLDLPYWIGLLEERRAAHVLDLACGTGRITLPLIEPGLATHSCFQIVGLDISEPFLERAQFLASELPAPRANAVRFVHGDMVDFGIGEQFDLIVIGLNSLMYVYALEDQLSCLRAVRRHLAPGGCFAIDVLTPSLQYLAEAERTPAMRLELDLAAPERGVTRFLRFAAERYDAATQLDMTTYFYELYMVDGRHERFTDDLAWHMYYPRELELLMRQAGMRPVAKYGSYNREPFNRRSKQMLWVMEGV
ncbi:MAG: class I SAM-dependent methyltransferase [Thermomicrobiales bacterium]